MTVFFETEGGVQVNAEEVTELRYTRDYKDVVVKMKSGNSHLLGYGRTIEAAMRSTQPVVKADAGYFKLTFHAGAGDHFVDRQPVVAWRVTPFRP